MRDVFEDDVSDHALFHRITEAQLTSFYYYLFTLYSTRVDQAHFHMFEESKTYSIVSLSQPRSLSLRCATGSVHPEPSLSLCLCSG